MFFFFQLFIGINIRGLIFRIIFTDIMRNMMSLMAICSKGTYLNVD